MATKHPSAAPVTMQRSEHGGMPQSTPLIPEDTPQDRSPLEPRAAQAHREPPPPAQMAPSAPRTSTGPTVAGRAIWYIGWAISVLLAFRFVLTLLGANAANAFAHFIYGVTTPLVSPFFSLFGYAPAYGMSRVEVFTLVAIAVYALAAWGLFKLVTIAQPQGR